MPKSSHIRVIIGIILIGYFLIGLVLATTALSYIYFACKTDNLPRPPEPPLVIYDKIPGTDEMVEIQPILSTPCELYRPAEMAKRSIGTLLFWPFEIYFEMFID